MVLPLIAGAIGAKIFGAGSLGATLTGAAGELIGSNLDGKRARKEKKMYYQRLRSAALAGGFHPLEALRADGGGYSQAGQIGPRLASPEAVQGLYDKFEDVLTGDDALRRERARLENELLRREVDKMSVLGGSGNVVERTARLQRSVSTDQGPVPLAEIARPTPITGAGDIDTQVDDGGTGVTLKPVERIVTQDGSSVDVTVGPDIDEMMTGAIVELSSKIRRYGDDKKMSEINRRVRGQKMLDQLGDKPLQWDPRFGPKKPKQWDTWNNKQKLNFVFATAK